MAASTESLARITQDGVESAGKLARISMDSAQRAIAIQLAFVRQSVEQAQVDARAFAQAKDVTQLMALRARAAGHALESWAGYSQGLMEVASKARAELSQLAEERLGSLREAGNAAFDTYTSAAREAAALADAGTKRGTTKRRAKK
ncbi:MAG TPA: phasin family protein [Usitatibacter sp.]|jgi:phasin family protein|nr:phasin family protein [Usitatibacter sp.]